MNKVKVDDVSFPNNAMESLDESDEDSHESKKSTNPKKSKTDLKEEIWMFKDAKEYTSVSTQIDLKKHLNIQDVSAAFLEHWHKNPSIRSNALFNKKIIEE